MKIRIRIIIILIAILSLSCSFFDSDDKDVVITVGSQKIGIEELKREIHSKVIEFGIKKERLKEAIDLLIRNVINEHLIIEYAKANNIQITESELNSALRKIIGDYSEEKLREELASKLLDRNYWKESIRRKLLMEKVLKIISKRIPPPTHEELKSYYNKHMKMFKLPEMVRFRQVVCMTKEQAEKARAELISQETAGSSKYNVLTTEKIDSQSGWIKRGTLDESIEKVLFSLPVGEVSPVFKSPYGYHVVQVLERRPSGYQSFTQALKIIERKLNKERMERYYNKWLQELRGKMTVKVNYELLKKVEFE